MKKKYKQNHRKSLMLYYVHSSIYAQQSNQYARCLMQPCRACCNMSVGKGHLQCILAREIH